MGSIDFINGDFVIDGVSTKTISGSLMSAGVPPHKVLDFLGKIYWGTLGLSPPAPFLFVTSLPQAVPACAPTYARTFVHADWVDGMSRVQAGMTPEEAGFNARFHTMETEFDGIAGEFAKLGGCLATLRGQVYGVLRELEAKITDLQNQIYNVRKDLQGWVDPKPGIVVAAPQASEILGTSFVDDKTMYVVKTGTEYKVVKATGGPLVNPVPKDYKVDVNKFKGLLDLIRLNEDFRKDLEAGMTVKDLTEKYKDTKVTGQPMADVLKGVSGSVKVSKPEDLVKEVIKATAAAAGAEGARELKETVLQPEFAGRSGAELTKSPVAALSGLDEKTESGLAKAGFTTVGKLAGASVAEVTAALKTAGVTGVTVTKVSGAVAAAKTAEALKTLPRK